MPPKKRRSVGQKQSQSDHTEIAHRWGAEWVNDFAGQSVLFSTLSLSLLQELKALSLLVALKPACDAIKLYRSGGVAASPIVGRGAKYTTAMDISHTVKALTAAKSTEWGPSDHIGSPYGGSTVHGESESEDDEIALMDDGGAVDSISNHNRVSVYVNKLVKRKVTAPYQARLSSPDNSVSDGDSEDELRISTAVKRTRRVSLASLGLSQRSAVPQPTTPQKVTSLTSDTEADPADWERVGGQGHGMRDPTGSAVLSPLLLGGFGTPVNANGVGRFKTSDTDVDCTPVISPSESATPSFCVAYHPPHNRTAVIFHSILESFPEPSDESLDLRLSQRDIQTLREGCRLNDKVINAVLELNPSRTCHVLDPLLFKPEWAIGRSQSRSSPPLLKPECNVVLVPVHHVSEGHWTLVVAYLETRLWVHLDSLSNSARTREISKDLRAFLEWMATRNQCLRDTKWEEDRTVSVDQQKNATDCGIYLLENAIRVIQNRCLSDPINPSALRLCYARQLQEARRQTDADQTLGQHSSGFSPAVYHALDHLLVTLDAEKSRLARTETQLKASLTDATRIADACSATVTSAEVSLDNARRLATAHTTTLHETHTSLDAQSRLLSHDESKLLILTEQQQNHRTSQPELARICEELEARRTRYKELQERIVEITEMVSENQARVGVARKEFLRAVGAEEGARREEKRIRALVEECRVMGRGNARLRVAVEKAWETT